MNKRMKQGLSWGAVFSIMGLNFYLSSQQAGQSFDLSYEMIWVTIQVVKFLQLAMVIVLGYVIIKGFKVKKRKISLKEGFFILVGLFLLYSLAGDLLRYLAPVNLHHFVRKNAHFFIYLVLGTLSTIAFKRSGYKGWKSVVLALVLCVLYAFTDEWHQTFVPGRGGLLSDVRIDSVGAGVGILIQNLISKIKETNVKNVFRLKKAALSAERNCKVD